MIDHVRSTGVLWSGDHLFEGTAETLDMLRSKGKQLVFVTNNSTKSREDYKKKFDKMGIPCKVVGSPLRDRRPWIDDAS